MVILYIAGMIILMELAGLAVALLAAKTTPKEKEEEN